MTSLRGCVMCFKGSCYSLKCVKQSVWRPRTYPLTLFSVERGLDNELHDMMMMMGARDPSQGIGLFRLYGIYESEKCYQSADANHNLP